MLRFLFPQGQCPCAFQRLLIACCLLVFAGANAHAQSTFGEILGTVHDSSGAVMQGVQVALVNTDTTASRSAVTDEMADVQIYLIRLADKLNVDMLQAVRAKMVRNAEKYPAAVFKGSARKYSDT